MPRCRPLQKQGTQLGRKPGRPRKTRRLASPLQAADASEADDSSAPEPSAQIPGTQPAALQPPDAVTRRRGPKPGRCRRKKPAAKFADPAALSAQSGDNAASVGVSGAPSVAAAASSPATSGSAGAFLGGSSGRMTTALDAVTELCRDVNPPGYASSDGATPVRLITAGRSRLHASSGVPPSPGALQLAEVAAAEQSGRDDAEPADDVTSSGAAVMQGNKVSPTALSAGPDIAVESIPTESADEAAGQQEDTPSGPRQPLPANQGPAKQPSNQPSVDRTVGNGTGDTVAEAANLGTPGEPTVQQGLYVATPATEGQPAKRKKGRTPGSKNKRARTAEQPESEGNRPRAVLAPSTVGPEPAVAATTARPPPLKQQGEGTDLQPAVATGSAMCALPAAVQRKRGRPFGSKKKPDTSGPGPAGTALLSAAEKQQGQGTDPRSAKPAAAPGSATGTLAAAAPVAAQSAAAEEPEQPQAPEMATPVKKRKGASAAKIEPPGSAQLAKKTGKEKSSASALAPEASPKKTRASVQQQSEGGAVIGKEFGAQPKAGSKAATVSQTKAPAAASQQTQTSAGIAEGTTGPARMAANDWRCAFSPAASALLNCPDADLALLQMLMTLENVYLIIQINYGNFGVRSTHAMVHQF